MKFILHIAWDRDLLLYFSKCLPVIPTSFYLKSIQVTDLGFSSLSYPKFLTHRGLILDFLICPTGLPGCLCITPIPRCFKCLGFNAFTSGSRVCSSFSHTQHCSSLPGFSPFFLVYFSAWTLESTCLTPERKKETSLYLFRNHPKFIDSFMGKWESAVLSPYLRSGHLFPFVEIYFYAFQGCLKVFFI